MTDVLTIGETLLAIRSENPVRIGGKATLSFAGAETNVAIGLARLGHKASWLGVLGDDPLSVQVQRSLQGEGVDCQFIRVSKGHSAGLVFFDSPLEGTKRVSYFRRNSAGTQLSSDDLWVIKELRPKILHLTGITSALSNELAHLMREAVTMARENGVLISLDVNHRSSLWSDEVAHQELNWLVRHSDIVFGSCSELKLAFGESVENGVAKFPTIEFIVKSGSHGAKVLRAGQRIAIPWEPRTVVDPVGSGDGFAAGYLSAVIERSSIENRLRRAHAVARFVVANVGDWEGLPLRSELPFALETEDVIR